MKNYVITIKYNAYVPAYYVGAGYWMKGRFIKAVKQINWEELQKEVKKGLRYNIVEKQENGMTIESKGYIGNK